jgi:biopolymer transport protein ExbD
MKTRIRALKQYSEDDAIINLTPLIDVVFVMLIMFIVVAPILELDQVELASAGVNSKEVSSSLESKKHITLHVKRNNQVLLNKSVVTMQNLKKELIDLKKRYPKETPMLFNDKHAYFGTYQELKNVLEDVGFNDLDIVLTP